MKEFLPKIFLCLQGYNFSSFRKDLLAGITVGIIALPLAMAFGIASGVTPEKGLVTAIIAGFLISFLGGSRVQIGGPTGAFVVLVYEIIQRSGYEVLALSTLVAALLLILLAVCRLGSWIKFVPHPLVTGFTTGIAVVIFSSQIKDFFGLKMGTPPADFLSKWIAYFHALPTMSLLNFSFSMATLILILTLRRYFPKIPWGIGAIALATVVSVLFQLPLETIQSKFGELPRSLPFPAFPSFSISFAEFNEILLNGVAIAFLGAIESLLSAVIADGMIGGAHRSNTELFAQGVANFASIIFGGIPATGAIARTAANVKSGAVSPLSGMIHALTLFLILFFFAPIVSLIPISSLAAVLMMVAWNMSELKHFFHLLKAPRGDVAILLIAFTLTVLVDITAAIIIGMIVSSFLFMQKMSLLAKTVPLNAVLKEADQQREFFEEKDPDAIFKKKVPEGVEVYEVQGPFFFGAADMLNEIAQDVNAKIFILRMRKVPFIDASGMHALLEFHRKCQKRKKALLLSGIHKRTEKDLERFGLHEVIGKECIFAHIDQALERAEKLLKEGS